MSLLTDIGSRRNEIQIRLQAALEESRVSIPGAAAGIYYAGERLHLWAGSANTRSGSKMGPETAFLLGSVTKVYTATLAMALCEQGRLDLDEPVQRYLPEFQVRDQSAAQAITVRQLLNHSSGIDGGDYIADFGWGDDAIALYVQSCKFLEQLHVSGQFCSYCNAGFVILGRLIEAVTGQLFDDAVRSLILEPLKLRNTSTTRDGLPPAHAALGHLINTDGSPAPVPTWTYPRALGPAGSTLYSTIEDFLTFVVSHLPSGKKLWSAERLKEMRKPQFQSWQSVQGYFGNTNLGLPWRLARWSDFQVLFHSGGSPGGGAYCLLIPDLDFALVTYGNSGGGNFVAFRLMQLVVTKLLGVRPPDLIAIRSSGSDVDESLFTGTFQRLGRRISILSGSDGHLRAEIEDLPFANSSLGSGNRREVSLAQVGARSLASGTNFATQLFSFIDEREGLFQFIETGRRISKRVSPDQMDRPNG